MENAPAPSILDSLRTVEFRMNLRGYSVDEVDEYLEKVAVEAEAVSGQLRAASDRLTMANDRIGRLEVELQRSSERPSVDSPTMAIPAPLPPAPPAPPRPDGAVSDDTLQRTLVLAQKFVDQTKRESEAEAADILKRADERARGMVAQAEERARQVAGETEQRLREEVSRLEGARARLSSDIEAMTRHLDEERGRIRSSLSEALRWLDEGLAPAPPAQPDPSSPSSGPADRGGRPADAPPAAPRPDAAAVAGSQVADRPSAQVAPRLRSVPGGAGAEVLFDQARQPE